MFQSSFRRAHQIYFHFASSVTFHLNNYHSLLASSDSAGKNSAENTQLNYVNENNLCYLSIKKTLLTLIGLGQNKTH